MKTIVILASGTRGDVQPSVALGQGLKEAGYTVRVASHAAFQPLVEGCSLSFTTLEGNPSELMMQAGGQSALTYDGSLLRSFKGTLRYYRAARPLYKRMLESAWQACQDADALVAGLPTLWAGHIAQALGVPCIWAFLQPFSRTRFHPSVLLPFTFSLGPIYNQLTHLLVEQFTWQPWHAEINRWRRQTLGLPQAPFWGVFHDLYTSGAIVLYGYSPSLAPPPPDWPTDHQPTGYWFAAPPGDWTPPLQVKCFLKQDPPPVYIGFGSPGNRYPDDVVQIVVQALENAGQRAVLSLPSGTSPEITLPPSVMPIGDIPHHWLFSRVSAVIHHGGAGTTGAGLRAGRPTLVLPMAIDQFYWGKRIAALGVGPKPIPQHSLEPGRLAQAIRQLTGDIPMRQRALGLGRQIAAENGVQRAVEALRKAGI